MTLMKKTSNFTHELVFLDLGLIEIITYVSEKLFRETRDPTDIYKHGMIPDNICSRFGINK